MVSFVAMTRLKLAASGRMVQPLSAFVPTAFHRFFLIVPCCVGSFISSREN